VIRKKTAARGGTRKPAKSRVTRSAPPSKRGAAPAKRKAPKPAPFSETSVPPAEAPALTTKQKRELRAEAHALEPLVHVGHGGVTDAVVQAVSRALFDHELIKVRLHEPEDKHGMAEQIASASRAALCGLVGHTLILYRPKPKQKGVSGVARTAIKRNRDKRGRGSR
jgi:RNA-binding protein